MSTSFFSKMVQEIYFSLDYIYPRFCLACGKSLSFTTQKYFCENCYQTIVPKQKNRCIACGQPLAYLKKCGKCKGKSVPWKQLWCAYDYENALVPLVTRWKIYGEEEASAGVNFFFQQEIRSFDFPAVDWVIPVPIHPNKLLERGFNPAEQLARLVSTRFHLSLQTNAVKRVKQKPHQKGLSEKERKHNLVGVFSCREVPPNILLIDDIMTTGSTLRELCKLLKQHGAKSIYCLVLARTPRYKE